MFEDQVVPVYCDIYQRKSTEELTFFRDYYFIKFMEGLNKLNRGDDRRCYSKEAIAYSEIMSNQSNNDQITAVSVINNLLSSSSGANLATNQPINLNTMNFSSLNKNIQLTCQKSKHLASPRSELFPKVAKVMRFEERILSEFGPAKSNEQLNDNREYVALRDEIVAYLNMEYVPYMICSDGELLIFAF